MASFSPCNVAATKRRTMSGLDFNVLSVVTTFDPAVQTFAPAVEVSGLDGFDAAKPAPTRGKRAKGG